MDENSQAQETSQNQMADQNEESSLQQEMDKEQKDGNEKTTSPIDLDAAATDDSQQTDVDKNVAAPSLIQQQRELRAQRAERERQEMAAAAAASAHIGMDISVATGEEKATSNTVSNAEVNTPSVASGSASAAKPVEEENSDTSYYDDLLAILNKRR